MTTLPTNKTCIVTFANRKNNYMKGLARLSDSLRYNFDGDLIAFTKETTIDCEPHELNPYAFKIKAIQKALESGYKKILWLDCSVFAIGNLQPVFDLIDRDGIVFQDAGHFLGVWSNDRSLEYFGLTRDEAMDIRMIGNAGFLGFDIDNPIGYGFFNKWAASMDFGIFKGEWNNNNKTESQDERCMGHRHDMQASSAILHQMGLLHLALPCDKILQYAATEYDKVLNDSIILKANGL